MTPATKRRRPVEMIEQRSRAGAHCEKRVRNALTRLTKTGAPFTIENVCDLAGVGRTFIYDKRRPALTAAVLAARDASRTTTIDRAGQRLDADTASWRERALIAEALAGSLRTAVRERDTRITDLLGQLYDPDGNHLVEENAELRRLVAALNTTLATAQAENRTLRRSLDGARANVKRERERNVTQIFPQ
ncbi:hypothetical protein [Nocardia wallacei]|uniref:hypothetical protein n=1 Tax=Nocardia wallacei TaxID=480035 RepID=UPI002453B9EE|nr:hypothetical protein [Nocardia wallacei]